MRLEVHRLLAFGAWICAGALVAATARAGTPSAQQALRLVPVQKGVDFDRPTAEQVAACTITPQKVDGKAGWVVEGPDGLILRRFVDTNSDNVVDQWSYYKDGLEVYRDIDADFDNKADQYRWFQTAGSRWGLDKDQDTTIDAWKAISAEEVTAEAVAALAAGDAERFARVALSQDEVASLGLGPAKSKALAKKIAGLRADFEKRAAGQETVTGATKWVQFNGNQPGLVPAGTDGSTKDLRVYENVLAIVQTDGKHAQVQIGTLVAMGSGWRVIDVPQPVSEAQADLATSGFFFQGPMAGRQQPASKGPSEQIQKLLGDLEKLDVAAAGATTPQKQAALNARRADLLEEIARQAASPQDRDLWLRQLADTVSAAVQSGTYPDGAKRLERLFQKLQKGEADKDAVAYVRFRQLTAEYGSSLQGAKDVDIPKIQADWLKKLEQYVADYPKSPDTAEAMMQLAVAQEFAGQEAEAKKWYGRITDQSPDSPTGRKAAGALTRLDSVGKQISVTGKSPSGNVIDLAKYRGRVVLIQYWATWCEPCKVDMAALKELAAKYGRSGFDIIGVNLDRNQQEMEQYVSENRLSWPQIYEEGGMDSRPANELGILTLPTMILVGPDGTVVNRNIRVAEIDRELQRLIRR